MYHPDITVMKKKINIAIDGPAASGKSTTARLVAEKLGYLYIDTGAMYRAATLSVLRSGANIHDEKAVQEIVGKSEITLEPSKEGQRTFLNGEDVSEAIRMPEITQVISILSAYPGVRRIMVEKQRQLAEDGGVVMDGRDIGTVVLPDAEVKVFMQATVEERARRRYQELKRKNLPVDFEEIKKDIEKRDRLDSSRAESPLKAAADAVIIDTSSMTINEQVKKVISLYNSVIYRT